MNGIRKWPLRFELALLGAVVAAANGCVVLTDQLHLSDRGGRPWHG